MKWLHFNPYTLILLQWVPPLSFSTWPRGESPTNPSKDPQSDTNPAQTTGETSVFPVAVTTWAILWRALPMIPLRRTFQRGPRCFQSLTPAKPRGSPVLSRSQPSTTFVRMRMKSWSSNCEPCHSLFVIETQKVYSFIARFSVVRFWFCFFKLDPYQLWRVIPSLHEYSYSTSFVCILMTC